MDSVAFITTDAGDDLIVSFAVQDPHDPTAVESLTLLRTPKYEVIFEDHERGVRASFERDNDEDDYVEEVRFSEQDGTVYLRTRARSYELDVRKVAREELAAMRKVLRKMNYDGRVHMSGV